MTAEVRGARLRLARAVSGVLAILLLGLSGPLGCRREPPPPTPRRANVLLVTLETLRADHVGAYGYSRNITPNLDRLARQGAVFQQVIAQAPFTLPSLASLMTGLTPPQHGVRNHPAELDARLSTLAERLAEAGYHTAAMTRHSWLRRRWGFDQGFDEYHNNVFSAGLDARSLSLAAIDWLAAREQGAEAPPFFLWLHFLDPHLPYAVGHPYDVLFHPDHQKDERVRHLRSMVDRPRTDFLPTPYADIAGGPYLDLVLRHYPDNPVLLDLALWRHSRGEIFFGKVPYPESALQEVRDLYDGAILYTDDNLARLLRSLAELGLEEDTLVIVAADHGEALGDHDLYFTHDFTLYDEVLRVPLVFRFPGVIARDTVIEQQVRMIDVTPTVLDLLGIETTRVPMEGVSLAPLLRQGTLPFLPAFAESAPFRPLFPEQERIYYQGNRGKWRMVRNERWKLIRIPHPKGDLYELYDLVSDPGETQNLYEELPGEVGKLLPLLDAWMAEDPDAMADTTENEQRALEELDPAARQLLETLGYVR